jgi:hypothetical protein
MADFVAERLTHTVGSSRVLVGPPSRRDADTVFEMKEKKNK